MRARSTSARRAGSRRPQERVLAAFSRARCAARARDRLEGGPGARVPGAPTGVDERGNLLVRAAVGEDAALGSGEVSLRLNDWHGGIAASRRRRPAWRRSRDRRPRRVALLRASPVAVSIRCRIGGTARLALVVLAAATSGFCSSLRLVVLAAVSSSASSRSPSLLVRLALSARLSGRCRRRSGLVPLLSPRRGA